MSAEGTRQSRERRHRSGAVLRDARLPIANEERTIDHSAPRHRGFEWRIVSFAIVVVMSAVLSFFYASDAFYIRSISVGGLRYLTKEEVFAFADIANMHIFWVNPQDVRANLMRSPSVADARVWLSWPPQMVNIIVEEREPALVWEQSGTAIWVDIQGRIMAQRQDRPDLVRISADMSVSDGPLGESGRVAQAVIVGALQLQNLMPEVRTWRYDPVRGLGFVNSNGWQVWFGTGASMSEKLAIYNTLASDLLARGIQAGEVNIVDPDHPFYTVMWGR
jgi:cell division septal protein FtsQ